jgi:hypothetical protein
MTGSKFLMNVAVCAVSIGGISTSYGADQDNTDEHTPVRGTMGVVDSSTDFQQNESAYQSQLVDADGRLDAGLEKSNDPDAGDNLQFSDEVDKVLNALRPVNQEVTFPQRTKDYLATLVPAASKLDALLCGVDNLVTAYNDLAIVATDQATEIDRLQAILESSNKSVPVQASEPVNEAPGVAIDTDTAKEYSEAVVKPQNVESSKWSYVAGGMVVGAAAVVATKLIVGSWRSIAAQFFRR